MNRDLQMLKGKLFDLPSEKQDKIKSLVAEFNKRATEEGTEGLIALELAGLSVQTVYSA